MVWLLSVICVERICEIKLWGVQRFENYKKMKGTWIVEYWGLLCAALWDFILRVWSDLYCITIYSGGNTGWFLQNACLLWVTRPHFTSCVLPIFNMLSNNYFDLPKWFSFLESVYKLRIESSNIQGKHFTTELYSCSLLKKILK